MTVSQGFSNAYTELAVDDAQGWLDVFARDAVEAGARRKASRVDRLEPRRRTREEPTNVFSGRSQLRRAAAVVAR